MPPPGTGLYELWKRGLYRNYHPDKLVDLVARVLALVPPWVSIRVLAHGCGGSAGCTAITTPTSWWTWWHVC